MSDVDYYRQAHLWGQGPDDYQVQVRADLLQILPVDVRSVLDVGCGDGYLTDALPPDLEVVGVDVSEEALRHVRRETRLGSSSALPFEVGSFDLVMSNDVLEHLDDEVLAATVREFDRVAARYVLLTVPFGERLEEATTRCDVCATVYHVNHHVRSWDEASLGAVLGAGWRVAEFRHSGALLCSRPDPLAATLRRAGIWHHWPGALCPQCGAAPGERTARAADLGRPILDLIRARAWWGAGPAERRGRDRSELMALFVRDGVDDPPRRGAVAPTSIDGDLLEVRFADPLRNAPEWTPGASVARFAPRGAAVSDSAGLRRGAGGPVWAEVALPLVLRSDDHIEVRWSGSGGLRLFGWDAVLGLEIQLEAVQEAPGRTRAVVGRPWLPGRYGTILQIHVDGDAVVESLRVVPVPDRASAAPLLELPGGHSVWELGGESPRRSWGCFAPAAGTLPAPVEVIGAAVEAADWSQVLQESDRVRAMQAEQLRLWAGRIQDLDAGRQELARGLEEEQRRLLEIRSVQAELESEVWQLRDERDGLRTKLDEALKRVPIQVQQARDDAAGLRKRLRGGQTVQRVLVVASWYPWQPQPGLGSFVHEQVVALRETCDLDVRVLCGRPFWLNTIRPWGMARGLAGWRAQMRRLSWSEWEGVPVLEFPYLVGMPFPFVSHSWTYRLAGRRLFERLGRTFRFDVVHAHTAYLDGTLGLALRRHFDVPVVVTEHTGPFSNLTRNPLTRARVMRSLREADRAFAVSTAHAEEIRGWMPVDDRDRLGVMHNGIDVTRFRPSSSTTPARPGSAPRFVAVGVFEDVKNPWLLLEAFELVARELPDARLTLIGDGPLFDPVRERAADGACATRIDFPGRLARPDLARHLRDSADVVVIASRAETFGMTAVEGLASGLPVVSTRCGGPEDVVSEPSLGQLCANDDPRALAGAMLDVARRLGTFEPGRLAASAAERFDQRLLAQRLHEIYTELVLERAEGAYR